MFQKASAAVVESLKERVEILEKQRDLLVTFTTAQLEINQEFQKTITQLVNRANHLQSLLVEAGVLTRVESEDNNTFH